ncbi:MAG: TetR family transcriptional regulator [Marivivens sp.]|nr:TetR family transcriptional regulator [Marivivens sp.]
MAADGGTLTPKARRTREALITAAREVIGAEGVGAANVLRVCAVAGVGRTSFYNYFEGMETLVDAVAEEAADAVRRRFDELHAEMPRGMDRLATCIEMILTSAVDAPQEMLLITALATDAPPIRALLEQEIAAELRAAGAGGAAARARLCDFLATGILALAREFALGRHEAADVRHYCGYLTAACMQLSKD